MRCEADRGCQGDGLEPELGEGAITLHMDMRGLTPFIAEKEEPIRADPIQGGHFARQLIACSGFDYTPRWLEGLVDELYKWFTEGFDTRDLKEANALVSELR